MTKEEFMQMFREPDIREVMKNELLDLIQHDPDVQSALAEIAKNVKKSRDSADVRLFRREVAKWVESKKGNNSANTITSGLYAAIKIRTGIGSMNGITDQDLPAVREAFQEFKKFSS